MLTVSEAAEEVGLTRAGLHKAIKEGRISATKNAKGQWQVDPAELFRVYQLVNRKLIQEDGNELTIVDSKLTAQRLELTERLLRQVEAERDHLKQKLDQAMTMLTHQPKEQEAWKKDTDVDAKIDNNRLLKKLFRGKGY